MVSLQLIPYILMNGKAKEAIEYYQEALNANVIFKQTIGEGPKEEASKFKENELDLIAHSVLKIGETEMMIADIIPELPFQTGNQISICITSNDISKTKQLYEKLKENGEVILELHETHFSPAYGIVTDQFGVTFQICTTRHK
jgi:PhnB protein